jgi:3-methyl-2-oxobutanoate hydroxymethyltransferase
VGYLTSSSTKRVSTTDLIRMKAAGKRITMLTAYDTLLASILDQAGIDVLLVGDSVSTVLAGEETTLAATLDQMIYHGRIARRGASRALVLVDLPFLTYQVSIEDAIRNAGRVMQQTGAGGVKLEGGESMAPTIRALVDVGIPVMGHLGFTPQSVHALGGPKIQGKEASAADRLVSDARAVEQAGAFAMVLELIPAAVAERVTKAVSIPTIGIGAGIHCDGQVLVTHDMLGMNEGFTPKFLKKYAELGRAIKDAAEQFAAEVRDGKYPGPEHSH